MLLRRLLVLGALVASLMPLAFGSVPAGATGPGGVFVTGHDPDFHSRAGNTAGAINIIRRAVDYVTFGAPAPTMLVVSSRIAPPGGHLDSVLGVQAAGYSFDIAADPGQGVLDLTTVAFSAYDVVVIASDFGGILRQAELDILNVRGEDLRRYVNGGGGVVAFAESNSGAHLTPAGGHFDFLPFLPTDQALNQSEVGFTVTPFGASLGLSNADVNGSASHNVFTATGGLEVVDVDGAGRIMSLATRGQFIGDDGVVPGIAITDVSVAEGNAGTTDAVFTISLSEPDAQDVATVDYSTVDGTALAGSDYEARSGSLTFAIGETVHTVTVPVNGDTAFEPDETFTLQLSNPNESAFGDDAGVGTITNDDPDNRAPACDGVTADSRSLWPANHQLRTVTLAGATDPDGDPVAITITGVTQDEALDGTGDGSTSPDAAAGATSDSVRVRAERAGGGDGRVYSIAFTGDDGQGGSCAGAALVSVPHDQSGAAAIDSGQTVDSFGI